MNTQFKKGVLEMCVLTLLLQRDAYGYELAEAISARFEIAEGTLYPLLRKLKLDGLCETYISEESGGPPRKYYRLTKDGQRRQAALTADWRLFAREVDAILDTGDGGKNNE